ncbi:MAG: hypothetical protein ACOY46_12315 [Bacillota bacterium]
MKLDTDGQVGDVLESLVQKIDRLNKEKVEEYERSRRALSSLDKLADAMTRLEYNKKREEAMAKKVARVYSYLERDSGTEGKTKAKTLAETVNGILNGAKATGQIIEIVANSIQVMMETVSNVVKSQSAGTRVAPQGTKGLDLLALLKPVNTMLNSLVSKQQSTEQPEEAKKESETKKETETKKEAENKKEAAVELAPVKKEPGSIPIVKAVPVGTEQEIT